MALYQGRIQHSLIVDKIVELLTTPPAGALEPYWTKVNSGTFDNEGIILNSKGMSGEDNIFFRIRKTTNYKLDISTIEHYEPNMVDGINGTVENEGEVGHFTYFQWNGNYSQNAPIHYWLSFDKDRIMISLKSDPVYASNHQSFAYIGLPERLSDEKDSTATTILLSSSAHGVSGTDYRHNQYGYMGACELLRNRRKETKSVYRLSSITGWKSKGWNNRIFLSDIYLHHDATEGYRAKLTGLHHLFPDSNQNDFRDGDEVTIGSKRFTILYVPYHIDGLNNNYAQSCFQSEWLAVEQLT